MSRAKLIPRLALAAALVPLLAAAHPATPAPTTAHAQSAADLTDRGNWTTIAGGDDILTLVADPNDPRQVWAGAEGGGVVIWQRTGERFGQAASWTFTQHLFPAPDGPAGNIVRQIAFDGLGRAWLATNGGVTLAEGALWRHDGPGAGLPAREILAIAAGKDGTIWAGTAVGVASLAPGASRWTVRATVPYLPKELTGKDGPGWARVVGIAVDQRGDVWLAHGRGGVEERPALSVLRAATGKWDHVAAVGPGGGGAVEEGPPSEHITALSFDPSNNRLWVATWGRGMVNYDSRLRVWRRPNQDGLCGLFVRTVFARDGAVWVGCGEGAGTLGSGIARWSTDRWETIGTGNLYWHPAAFTVSEDRVWIGANGPRSGGIRIVLDISTLGATALTTSDAYLPARTPIVNPITALQFEPNGTLWAGTRGAGVLRRAKDGKWTAAPAIQAGGWSTGDTVTDLALRSGELWVAATQTYWDGQKFPDGGVGRIDLRAPRWLLPIQPSPTGLPDGDVSSLAVGPDGRVWMGMGAATGGSASPDASHAGNGVAVFDPATNVWAYHRYDPNATRQMTGDTVLDLAVDGSDVWAAASYHLDPRDQRNYGGGVSVLRPAGWTGWLGGDAGLEIWHGDRGKPGSMAFITGDVRSVAVGPNHTVWSGSWSVPQDESLIERWPAVDAVASRFDGTAWTSQTFPDAGWVSAFATDRDGRVWVGTTRGHAPQELSLDGEPGSDSTAAGLYVRGTDGTWTALDPANSGITANAVTALAVDPTSGDVWIGTENGGLSVFHRRAAPPTPTATACPSCRTPTATPTPRAMVTPSASATPGGPIEATPTPGGSGRLFLPWAAQGWGMGERRAVFLPWAALRGGR